MTNLIGFIKMKYEQFIMREAIRFGFIDNDNKLINDMKPLIAQISI